MGFLSRLFSKKDEGPVVVKGANDSAPAAASTPADDDIFPVPEAIRQFMIEQHGFDPLKNPLRPSVVCPEAHARRVEERRIAEQALKNPQPGQLMPDGTVYLGQCKPKNRNGKSLRKTFNVFAAPEDLPEIMTYSDTVNHIAGLKNWHGYDGANCANDTAIYTALENGSYKGGWIIPTCDILRGRDVDGKHTTFSNIHACKDKGSFKGTFKMAESHSSYHHGLYWSSTEDRGCSSAVWIVRMSNDNFGVFNKNDYRMSCRPVRLVEIKP